MPRIAIRRSLVFLSDMLIIQPWKFEERRSTPLLFRITLISKKDFQLFNICARRQSFADSRHQRRKHLPGKEPILAVIRRWRQ